MTEKELSEDIDFKGEVDDFEKYLETIIDSTTKRLNGSILTREYKLLFRGKIRVARKKLDAFRETKKSKIYAKTITKNTPLIELAEFMVDNKGCLLIACDKCPLLTRSGECKIDDQNRVTWAKEYLEYHKKLKFLENL